MKAEEVEEAEKQALIELRRGWAYGGGGQGEGVLFTGAGEEGGRGGWGGGFFIRRGRRGGGGGGGGG